MQRATIKFLSAGFLALCACAMTESASGESIVEVEGIGATSAQAREEAIRTALQATVAQLVISDRLIENSEVVRDDIMTTANGFVTSFEILERSRTEAGEYRVQARVGVSEETILNYVSYQQGGESKMDGASLFAEVQRGNMHREALEQMLRRFVRGYPWDVIELKLDRVQPLSGASGSIRAEVTAVSDPEYFRAMEQFLANVASASYPSDVNFTMHDDHEPPLGPVRSYRKDDHYDVSRRNILRFSEEQPATRVCLATGSNAKRGRYRGDCYIFPPGNYLSFLWESIDSTYPGRIAANWQAGTFMLLISFLDAAGQSVVRPDAPDRVGECLLVGRGGDYPEPGIYQSYDSGAKPTLWFRAYPTQPATLKLSDADVTFNLILRTSDFDVSRAAAFRGRPVLVSRGIVGRERRRPGGGIEYRMDITGDPMDPEALCDELLRDPVGVD